HVEPAIFCFKDFHPFMNDPVIVRKLRELAQYLKSTYTTVVLSSPIQRIPMELEKDIAVVEFGLPDEVELRELLERTIEEVSRNTPIKIRLTEEEKERIVQAALGLTLSEAENVFAKTLIKRGGLGAEHLDVIISEKEQIVRKSGLLEYYAPSALTMWVDLTCSRIGSGNGRWLSLKGRGSMGFRLPKAFC
ncbi:MAG: ATPase, partial [Candidatus Fervidibacter sacchari]